MYFTIAPNQLYGKCTNYLPQKCGVNFVFSPQEMKFDRLAYVLGIATVADLRAAHLSAAAKAHA